MDLGLGGRGHLPTGASRGPGPGTARAPGHDGVRVLVPTALGELGRADAALVPVGGRTPGTLLETAGVGAVAAAALSPVASHVTGAIMPVHGGVTR